MYTWLIFSAVQGLDEQSFYASRKLSLYTSHLGILKQAQRVQSFYEVV